MENKLVLNVVFRKEKSCNGSVIATYFDNATAWRGHILCYTHEK